MKLHTPQSFLDSRTVELVELSLSRNQAAKLQCVLNTPAGAAAARFAVMKGTLPLATAAKRGHLAALQVFLRHAGGGGVPNWTSGRFDASIQRGGLQRAALGAACTNGHAAVVQLFLRSFPFELFEECLLHMLRDAVRVGSGAIVAHLMHAAAVSGAPIPGDVLKHRSWVVDAVRKKHGALLAVLLGAGGSAGRYAQMQLAACVRNAHESRSVAAGLMHSSILGHTLEALARDSRTAAHAALLHASLLDTASPLALRDVLSVPSVRAAAQRELHRLISTACKSSTVENVQRLAELLSGGLWDCMGARSLCSAALLNKDPAMLQWVLQQGRSSPDSSDGFLESVTLRCATAGNAAQLTILLREYPDALLSVDMQQLFSAAAPHKDALSVIAAHLLKGKQGSCVAAVVQVLHETAIKGQKLAATLEICREEKRALRCSLDKCHEYALRHEYDDMFEGSEEDRDSSASDASVASWQHCADCDEDGEDDDDE